MKYRLDRRAKLYRVRHLGVKWRLLVGVTGVVAVGGAGLMVHDVPRVFGFSKESDASVTSTKGPSSSSKKTGSSKKPPEAAAASQSLAKKPNAVGMVRTAECGSLTPLTPGLAAAADSGLRKLAQYEQACGGRVATRTSFFVPTPVTISQAHSYAADVVARLQVYAQYGISPLVFMEPDSATGNNLDLVQYQNGAYDAALDAYFAAIKAAGVTDVMMGNWVMFPEGNIPVWTSVDPTTYAAGVTKVAQFQKKYFPGSQTSVMLDSQTYPSANSWSGGAYVSFAPYLQGIPKGLINSFGLQGFPWAPPANDPSASLYDPQVYLPTNLATEAAHTLGVNDIWLNTGTFSRMYANNAAQTVSMLPSSRQVLLDGVVSQAKSLQKQGFTVSVHMFAQDKSATTEAVDWSYWRTPGDSPATDVFKTFDHDLNAAGIPLWIFDTY